MMYHVDVENFHQWRQQARVLLMRQIAPAQVAWQSHHQASLFGASGNDASKCPIVCDKPKIPSDFFAWAKDIACYRDDHRWSLLYSLAFRLVFEDKHLLRDEIDPQVAQARAFRKAVSRDKHKMKAFVRFKKIRKSQLPNAHLREQLALFEEDFFVAWFEPEHLILPALSNFFSRRFNNMFWSILTPDQCMHWNTEQMAFSPGAPCPPKINDNLEELWCAYYANIFNPARLKIKAMQSEMPKKYWRNLPEAALIPELMRNAGKRTDTMLTTSESPAWQKTQRSRFVKTSQQALRGHLTLPPSDPERDITS